MKNLRILFTSSLFVLGLAACTGSGSNGISPKLDSSTSKTSSSSTQTIDWGSNPAAPVKLTPSPLLSDLTNQGFKIDHVDSQEAIDKMTKALTPLKQTIIDHKEMFQTISYSDFFEYDAVYKVLRVSEDQDANQLELDCVLEMKAYGQSLGDIAIDTPALVPHLAWPQLKAKIDPFKDRIKARAKYIHFIRTTNVSDNFTPALRILEVNEESGASYLETALKQIDESKTFLDQLPAIHLVLKASMLDPSDLSDNFETLQLLAPVLKKLGQTMSNFQLQTLRIDSQMGLHCDFQITEPTKTIDLYTFNQDDIKQGRCSPSELASRIEASLAFESETKMKISEAYNLLGPIVVLGPSQKGLKEVLDLKDVLLEKKEKFNEVRIQTDFETGAACRASGKILFISEYQSDLATTQACIEALKETQQ